ncbi:KxYKxGKxW signal peptide domain-containing protein, partial [uncultured Limosilactobacillus sp.]
MSSGARYKLYKSGKQWCVMAIAILASVMSL